MRLCTNCISCMELPLLPKRARFLSEPPPNRLQTSKRTSVLLRTIPADGQDENKGKPRKDILTASLPARKRRRLDGGCLDSRPSQEQYTSRRPTPFVTHFSEDSRFLTTQQFHTPRESFNSTNCVGTPVALTHNERRCNRGEWTLKIEKVSARVSPRRWSTYVERYCERF